MYNHPKLSLHQEEIGETAEMAQRLIKEVSRDKKDKNYDKNYSAKHINYFIQTFTS